MRRHLAESGLSKRTIQNHVDNMWVLGGEIIRDLNEDPSLRKVAAEQLIRNVIHEDGGPLIRWDLEEKDGVTTVRLTHSGFTSETSRATYRGWPQVLGGLQSYVEQQV